MQIENGLYKCTKCLKFQPKENFHKKKNSLGIRSVCKNCRSFQRKETYKNNRDNELLYNKEYKINFPEKRKETSRKSTAKRLKKFRQFLNSIKNVPCLDCKVQYPPCVMDFDHRIPDEKIINVSEMCGFPHDQIINEISKCDIVCANCHRIREHNRRNSPKISYINNIIYPFKDKPCMDCKISYPLYVMDFDHKNIEEKLFNIATPKGHSKEEVLLEISKCEVVCANCHRIRTFVGNNV